MTGKCFGRTWLALVCAGWLATAVEARAQSNSSAASAASAAAAANYSNMTMGMGFLPMPGMFGTTAPSAVDAAALGMTAAAGRRGWNGDGRQHDEHVHEPYGFAVPVCQHVSHVAAAVRDDDAGRAGTELGLGSGLLSGVRPGGPALRGCGDGRCRPCEARHGASPGGLAARYFNRTSTRAAHPARLLQSAKSALSASWAMRIFCVVSI